MIRRMMKIYIYINFFIFAMLYPAIVINAENSFRVCPANISSDFIKDLYLSNVKLDFYGKYDLGDWNKSASVSRKISQEKAREVLGVDGGIVVLPIIKGADIESKIKDLEEGDYLMIVRGEEESDSNKYIKFTDDGHLYTISRSKKYEYAFEPQLVTIPASGQVYIKAGRQVLSNNSGIDQKVVTDNSISKSEENDDGIFKQSEEGVKTGDENPIAYYCVLLFIALAGGIILLIIIKKRR